MKTISVMLFLTLSFGTLPGQDRDPAGPVRVENQPRYVAPDGSVSEITKGEPASKVGAWRLIPSSGDFVLTFVIDDAAECVGPHSVEHNIHSDTLTVTLFDNAPAICPGVFTPREYRLAVTHLNQRRYLLRVYLEGRGGRGGQASGAAPWLAVNVYGL